MYVPDQYKIQEICDKVVEEDSWLLKYVPDNFKKQKMCNKAVKEGPWLQRYVPDNFKRQKMKAVKKNPHKLSKKWKAQKAKIKEELPPIAWHPSR